MNLQNVKVTKKPDNSGYVFRVIGRELAEYLVDKANQQPFFTATISQIENTRLYDVDISIDCPRIHTILEFVDSLHELDGVWRDEQDNDKTSQK